MANSMVVVTAHVGDFVWRCGGAMALHAQRGVPVHLVCLSYGENGESNSAWKGDTQREAVKAQRHAEAQAAAQILGVSSVDFHDRCPTRRTPCAAYPRRCAARSRRWCSPTPSTILPTSITAARST